MHREGNLVTVGPLAVLVDALRKTPERAANHLYLQLVDRCRGAVKSLAPDHVEHLEAITAEVLRDVWVKIQMDVPATDVEPALYDSAVHWISPENVHRLTTRTIPQTIADQRRAYEHRRREGFFSLLDHGADILAGYANRVPGPRPARGSRGK